MIRNIARLIFTIIISCNLSFSQSKYIWQTGTSGGYTYKYVTGDPMKARFYTLKNGLMVILSENHKEPRIQTLIPVRAGSNTDPQTHTGLAHYLEHMLFKGTDKFGTLDWAKEKPILQKIDSLYEKYNHTTDTTIRRAIYQEIDQRSGEASKFSIANEYDKMMTSMGGQGSNAHTWFEETVYEEDIPSNAVDRFLALQAERFRNPVLRIFHTELEAVYEEKNRSLDSDGWKMEEAKDFLLFPTHNYGQQTTIGTIEHLKNPSLFEIRNFYNKYYVSNNMAVVMAGDFNSDNLIKKIDKAFAYMKAKSFEEYKPEPEAPLKGTIKKDIYGPTPDNLLVAWRWPGAINTKERVVGTIVDELMSNAKAGLIDLNLVKAQKVLKASCSPQWMKDYSSWQMTGTPKNGQSLEEVKDLLMNELDKLKNGDFDESIIKAIASNYKLNNINSLESNGNRANTLMQSFIVSRAEKWNSTVELTDLMAKVTKKQVMDFAKTYCGDGNIIVYKHKGEDKNIVKVEKPEITPVEMNRNEQSEFLNKVNQIPMANINPVFLDFNKDMKKSKIGKADLLYVQNTENDIFSMVYRFDMGSWNSKLLPVALQYLNFLGTEKYNADQISTEFYKLASNFNAGFSDNHTNLSISGLGENFSKTITLFEDLIRNCKADENALALLKGRIMKQRADSKLDKRALLSGLSQYAQYGAKNPRNTLVLSNDELEGLKANDLIDFLHNLFNYQHLVTYYGPKEIEALKKEVTKSHMLPVNFKANLPQIAKFEKITPTQNQVLFTDYDMVQAEINWIRPTETFSISNSALVDLYNNYFGSGMASIVFQTIRESKALAYSTYAHYQSPVRANDKYVMIGYIGAQADKLPEAIKAMNELFNVFPEVPKAFEMAKESLRKTYETERITQDGIINSYLMAKEKGIDYDERKKIMAEINKIGLLDLKAFQNKNIANKPIVYCLVASEKKVNLDDMKSYGVLKKLTKEEIFGY